MHINTPEHENRLIDAAQEGDPEALEKLLDAYRPMLGKLVREFGTSAVVDRDDLEQEAALGFMEAVFDFDTARQARLATWGGMKARLRLREVVADSKPIRIPSSTLSLYQMAMNRAEGDYAAAVEYASTEAPTKMTRETFAMVHETLYGSVELDGPADEHGHLPHETVVPAPEYDPQADALADALAELPETLRFIVRAYYGLVSGEPMTDEEISEYLLAEFEVSMSRATVQRRRMEGERLLQEVVGA